MRVEPVAETSAHARVVDQRLADVARRRSATVDRPSGALAETRDARARTGACVAERRQRRLLRRASRRRVSPQTSASAAFQAHTATGKLNAEMTPTTPSGCQVSIMRWPGRSRGDRQAVELARQADGEVADVDHLLHFAEAFAGDLAGLDGDEAAQRLLVGAQLLAEQAHQLAAAAAPAPCARPGRPAARLAIAAVMSAALAAWTAPITAPSIGLRMTAEPPATVAAGTPRAARQAGGGGSSANSPSAAQAVAR